MIRSPFTALAILALTIGLLWMHFIAPPSLEPYRPWVKLGALLLITLFIILVLIHNRRHPHNKLSLLSWTPYEFKEEDEGMKWITLQACRKVYMFYYFAIPAGALLIAVFHSYSFMPLLMLFVLGGCQYWIYWREIRKYLQQEKG
ncbi:hypothetical protein DUZ99_14095 [Xylanibacillus composti]|nr:hypothetical protein [Xylanibacillus composti]